MACAGWLPWRGRRLSAGPSGLCGLLPGRPVAGSGRPEPILAERRAGAPQVSTPAEHLPRRLLEAFERHGGAASAGLRRGLHLRVELALAGCGWTDAVPPLADCERMLAEKRGEKMTAMLDATLARWEEAKFAQGVEQGLAQGRIALLGRIAQWRFGAGVARQVTALLADVSDVACLDETGRWLVECESSEMLLARLRTSALPRGPVRQADA